MFTFEIQPTPTGYHTFHCFFCDKLFYAAEGVEVVVLEDGNPVRDWRSDESDVVCYPCLKLDAAGQSGLLRQQVPHLRQRANALEALLAAGDPAVPPLANWERWAKAMRANRSGERPGWRGEPVRALRMREREARARPTTPDAAEPPIDDDFPF